MLLEFSVENFLSFKNKITFSMVPASISEHQDTHVFGIGNFNLLKSAVLYGANAGGKSNLFSAMKRMRFLIINSSKESQATENLNIEPFKLSTLSEKEPSMFEIVFIHENVLYRYGFVADQKRVFEEWLYHRPDLNRNKEQVLFVRNNESIEIKPKTAFFEESKGLEKKTRDNALFISVVANFNGKISMGILEWMQRFDFLSGTNNNSIGYTASMLDNKENKEKILGFIQAADFDIEDLQLENVNLERLRLDMLQNQLPKEVLDKLSSAQIVTSRRKKFNEFNEPIGFSVFDVSDSESEGTKKILSLAGPIIEKLREGGVLVVDELDAKLHPLLTKKIIDMFNSYDINTKNAQLIFATHDVTNLNKETFRRDQVWFAEKDQYGATDLYSLIDYKEIKVRNDASYGKDYLLGKYGSVPNLGNLHLFLEESIHGDR